mmetsp:Transcript_29996/g.53212  ORF Transcript_29996/g.53212 Transcript_29996/m.53212 type:complete len:337 (-) Transcript_29996:2014-3024(-)
MGNQNLSGMACQLSRHGLSILAISQLLGTSTDAVLSMIVKEARLPLDAVVRILNKSSQDAALEQISEEEQIRLEVLAKFLCMSPKPSYKPEHLFIFKTGSKRLQLVNLETGKLSHQKLFSYTFIEGSSLTELPSGDLVVAGGFMDYFTKNVDVIRQRSEYAVSTMPQMLSARCRHGAVYFDEFVYVVGGMYVKQCERYSLPEERWEALPDLPQMCWDNTVVSLETTRSLYSIGGSSKLLDGLNLIQKLDFESLSWNILPIKLPYAEFNLACFKLEESHVFIVLKKSLYVFHPSTNTLQHIRKLSANIQSWKGESYFSKGSLYSFTNWGVMERLDFQ